MMYSAYKLNKQGDNIQPCYTPFPIWNQCVVPDINLDYCDSAWFALEMNRNHSVVFEIASKYCILDSFVDYDGYSISSKGFLPTVVT